MDPGDPTPRSAATAVVVLGGFLGAGKTTALLRLAERWKRAGRRVGVIANDQAEGLVDTARFRAAGFAADEVSGGCFCCRFDDFVARAEELLAAARPDVILAEPVGSCTDLVATVLRPLEARHGRRFAVAPYVVLVDPLRARQVLARRGAPLSEKVAYIFRLQQQEAAALAISKIDLLSTEERGEVEQLLRQRFPDNPVLGFSSATGEGFDALATLLETRRSAGRALASEEIDYDTYAAGEAELGWLNRASELRAEVPIDLDAALLDLAQALESELAARGIEIAHGKLLLHGEGRFALASAVSTARPAELAERAEATAQQLELVTNLRALGDPAALTDALERCAASWRARHRLQVVRDDGRAFRPPRPVPTHELR